MVSAALTPAKDAAKGCLLSAALFEALQRTHKLTCRGRCNDYMLDKHGLSPELVAERVSRVLPVLK